MREASTENDVWWGQYNRPFNPESFSGLHARLCGYLQGRDVFVQDVYGGADPEHRLAVRVITQKAWHSLFARTMFLKNQTLEQARRHVPDFTIIAAPGFQASPLADGTRSETFIVLNFRQKLAIIGGTGYAGEIKKTVFTVLNYLLPLEGVLSMHCSANVGKQGDVAIFFGLSGTGKTTLSADPSRNLVGDDEHGWGTSGVFNFEDGCYAKVIRLSADAEPQIYGDDAPLRDDPRERRLRPGHAPARPQRRASDREHARRLPARLHRERRPRQAGRPPEKRRLPDLRRERRHAADLAAVARPGDLPLHLGLHQQDRRHRDRARHRAGDHVQRLLRRPVHGPPPVRLRRAAEEEDAPAPGAAAGSSTPAGPAGRSASASASASATPAGCSTPP